MREFSFLLREDSHMGTETAIPLLSLIEGDPNSGGKQMWMRTVLFLLISLILSLTPNRFALAEGPSGKVGFLLVAPDRGFLGNQEIRTVYEEFKRNYLASLAWVGKEYSGVKGEYSSYLTRAVDELHHAGATEIIAIPIFLSEADPVFRKVAPHLTEYAAAGTIRWEAPMQASFLIAQILLDRVDALSREPSQERLLVLGLGATDEATEVALHAGMQSLTEYVSHYRPFKEIQIGIYYDREATAALREKKNSDLETFIIQMAAKRGRTLIIPFFIGQKMESRMSMAAGIADDLKELNVIYDGQEIFPHPNILLWLKRVANAHLPASESETGIVIMPHGAGQQWNDAIEEVVAPIGKRYQTEMAYGMADPVTIQQAISRLEAKGVRSIVFVRMYALSDEMKQETDYLLGLSLKPPEHAHDKALPAQIRSGTIFASFGGYQEDPGMVEILHARIVEISRKESEETVILVGHGAGDDEENAHWLAIMGRQIAQLRRDPHCGKIQAMEAATVREDWPEKRAAAVERLKQMIIEGKKRGRVILISYRLRGAGPYKRFLEKAGLKEGEDYEINGKGFLPHPAMTRWLEAGIEQELRKSNEIGSSDGRSSSPKNQPFQ